MPRRPLYIACIAEQVPGHYEGARRAVPSMCRGYLARYGAPRTWGEAPPPRYGREQIPDMKDLLVQGRFADPVRIANAKSEERVSPQSMAQLALLDLKPRSTLAAAQYTCWRIQVRSRWNSFGLSRPLGRSRLRACLASRAYRASRLRQRSNMMPGGEKSWTWAGQSPV